MAVRAHVLTCVLTSHANDTRHVHIYVQAPLALHLRASCTLALGLKVAAEGDMQPVTVG